MNVRGRKGRRPGGSAGRRDHGRGGGGCSSRWASWAGPPRSAPGPGQRPTPRRWPAAEGRDAAADLAVENGGTLVSYAADEGAVLVTVSVGRAVATARAALVANERAPSASTTVTRSRARDLRLADEEQSEMALDERADAVTTVDADEADTRFPGLSVTPRADQRPGPRTGRGRARRCRRAGRRRERSGRGLGVRAAEPGRHERHRIGRAGAPWSEAHEQATRVAPGGGRGHRSGGRRADAPRNRSRPPTSTRCWRRPTPRPTSSPRSRWSRTTSPRPRTRTEPEPVTAPAPAPFLLPRPPRPPRPVRRSPSRRRRRSPRPSRSSRRPPTVWSAPMRTLLDGGPRPAAAPAPPPLPSSGAEGHAHRALRRRMVRLQGRPRVLHRDGRRPADRRRPALEPGQPTGTLDNVEGFFREAFQYDSFKLQSEPIFRAGLTLARCSS